MSRVFALVLVLALFHCVALAKAGLDEQGIVDRVIIERRTGQATLVMLIDRSLTNRRSASKAHAKLKRYRRFVDTGDLKIQFSSMVDERQPVQILFFHYQAKSDRETQALAALGDRARELRFIPVFRELESRAPLDLPSSALPLEPGR